MKILCVGRNYSEHAKELGNAVPENPVIFSKPDTALLKNGEPFYIPDFSNDVHHEIELVIKINKVGKKIQEKFARNYFSEIGLGIDFTARDKQNELKAKGNTHPNVVELRKSIANIANIKNNKERQKALQSLLVNRNTKKTYELIKFKVANLLEANDIDQLTSLVASYPSLKTTILNQIFAYIVEAIHTTEKNDFVIKLLTIPELVNYYYNGGTLLHTASRKNNIEIIVTLIVKGAEKEVKSKEGFTPLQVAGDSNTELLLIGLKCNIPYYLSYNLLNTGMGYRLIGSRQHDPDGDYLINNMFSQIKQYLNPGPKPTPPISYTGADGLVHPITYEKEGAEIVNWYIDTLYDTDTPSDRNIKQKIRQVLDVCFPNRIYTAVNDCVRQSITYMYLLLPEVFRNHPKNLIDVNLADKGGRTLLHWAVAVRNDKAVAILCGLAADKYKKDNNGSSPNDYTKTLPSDIIQLIDDIDDTILEIDRSYTKDALYNCNKKTNENVYIEPRGKMNLAALKASGIAGGRKIKKSNKTRSKRRPRRKTRK
jgi:ankyrin repeat protein